jgi:hypothetical protein
MWPTRVGKAAAGPHHRGFHLVLWMQRCSSPGLQGFQNRRPESTDRNGGLPSLLPDRFPRPHPHRRKASSCSAAQANRTRRCAGRRSLVALAQLSVSAAVLLPGQIYPSSAGAFWKFRRAAVLRLRSCPSRAVVLIRGSSRLSLGETRKGRKKAAAAEQARVQRYRFTFSSCVVLQLCSS